MADEQNITTRTNPKRGEKNGKEKEQPHQPVPSKSTSSAGEQSTPPQSALPDFSTEQA